FRAIGFFAVASSGGQHNFFASAEVATQRRNPMRRRRRGPDRAAAGRTGPWAGVSLYVSSDIRGMRMTAEMKEPLEGTPLIQPSTTDHPLYDAVADACRSVYDPEIPVNIFDLGLVYTIEISADNAVRIVM